MSNCNTCVHKIERCFCPPGKRCTIYKAEKKIVEHTFKFKTDKNWIPGVGMCWTGCPFSMLVGLGEICKFVDSGECPFERMKN